VVTLQLADNQNACGNNGSGIVSGSIQTPAGKKLPGATAILTNTLPEMVRATTTDANGFFSFSNVPFYQNYELQGVKNDDYTNGVSTLDLVLTQRHILGIEQLNNAYKVIAADVNKDEKVNTTDLVELRKLILGLYNELPNNGSWRFIDAAQTFINANQPWPVFEKLNIPYLENDKTNMNFVSVKVGDVNGNAVTNVQDENIESRSVTELTTLNQEVTKDEIVIVDMSNIQLSDVFGFQFTLALKDAELMNIMVNNRILDASHIAQIAPGLYTISWNDITPLKGDALFSVELKALKNGNISDMIQLNSQVTKAEIYHGNTLETNKLSLRFGGMEKEGFVLRQNEPNPFQDVTNIQFNLPEAGDATLTIMDVTGKVLYTKSGSFGKGMNAFQVSKNDLNTTGVMIYKVESGQHSATAKMIGLE
jgi:hypothetical protein